MWLILEEDALPTPLLDVRSASASSIDITLTFRSAKERALVEKNVRHLLGQARDVKTRSIIAALLSQENAALERERRQVTAWRLRAVEMRAIADQFSVPSVQETLRRTAANYEQMADHAEALLTDKPLTRGEETG